MKTRCSIILALIFWTMPCIGNIQLPYVAINTEYSNQFGLVVNPKYANILGPTSALGLELAFGGNEFRLGATWAKLICCQHMLKLTAEYFSQNILFDFESGESTLWNEQHAFGANYSYLLHQKYFSSVDVGVYHAHARDESLLPLQSATHPDFILCRNAVGSNSYGINAGLTAKPWTWSQLKLDLFYDDISYRTTATTVPNRSGLGESFFFEQVLHPRFLIGLEASHRELFDRYSAKMSWLIPVKQCARLELSLNGQYITGDLPQPHETRVGMMLSYNWDLPHSCPTYLTGLSLQEMILASAIKPVVRMPDVFVHSSEFERISS